MKPIFGIAIVAAMAIASTTHLPKPHPTEWEKVCNEVDEKLTEGWYIGEEAKAAQLLLDVCIVKQGEEYAK